MTDQQIEYKGLYHKYTTGEVYTEPMWNSTKSIQLIPYVNTPLIVRRYKQIKPKLKTKYNSIYPFSVSIDIDDIKKTYITRYFLQKQTDYSIIEIDSDQYDDLNSGLIDPNLYISVTLNWYITGPILDTGTTIKVLGVLSKNTASINQAEKVITNIRVRLSNLSEYYTDVDFKVPADINV
jgi:hypothetical protein